MLPCDLKFVSKRIEISKLISSFKITAIDAAFLINQTVFIVAESGLLLKGKATDGPSFSYEGPDGMYLHVRNCLPQVF